MTGRVWYNGYSNHRGGLLGRTGAGGLIEDCVSEADVCGRGGSVGGLVGVNESTMVRSKAAGAVRGRENVGGLIGYNRASLTECCATGDVSNNSHVPAMGGLCGVNAGGRLRQC